MKRLIVNADDFGFTSGVNAGILRAYKDGILTSTTIMANGTAFEEAVQIARSNPGLGVGCHLALVGERAVAPVLEISSLVDDSGLMPATLGELAAKLTRGAIRSGHLERELSAQIEKVMQAGITPSHLDTHKHTHLHPQVLKVLVKVAVRYGVTRIRRPFQAVRNGARGPAAREAQTVYFKQHLKSLATQLARPVFNSLTSRNGIKTPDRFFGVSLTGLVDTESMEQLLSETPAGTSEIMCHPGIYDDELELAHTRLKQSRQRELEALTDERVKLAVAARGIKLISYREL
ncbi:MAG TPA: ChbG/HpnK family deacetylase [Blastocatellia bacterium]|nr:ChbG/HpnK family deacetylase [Blastocatellia bacterium]